MKIHRLKGSGIALYTDFLNEARSGGAPVYPSHLLMSEEHSEPVGGDAKDLDALDLNDKLATAAAIDRIFGSLSIKVADKDAGLWSWMTLYLFDRLRASGKKGNLGANERWIAAVSTWRRYYRHMLAGPWQILRAHADNPRRVRALLCGPVGTFGDINEQFASRLELIVNPGLMETVTRLYWDEAALALKRGAGGKGKGSARRLSDVLAQFERTYDLYSMSADEITSLLPKEFERFK